MKQNNTGKPHQTLGGGGTLTLMSVIKPMIHQICLGSYSLLHTTCDINRGELLYYCLYTNVNLFLFSDVIQYDYVLLSLSCILFFSFWFCGIMHLKFWLLSGTFLYSKICNTCSKIYAIIMTTTTTTSDKTTETHLNNSNHLSTKYARN